MGALEDTVSGGCEPVVAAVVVVAVGTGAAALTVSGGFDGTGSGKDEEKGRFVVDRRPSARCQMPDAKIHALPVDLILMVFASSSSSSLPVVRSLFWPQ